MIIATYSHDNSHILCTHLELVTTYSHDYSHVLT